MTEPVVDPPDWVINVPSTDAVHDEPPPADTWEGISDTALQGIRKNLIEAIVGLIGQLPDIALNLIRQLITMIDNAEDLIFELINMVLGWVTQAPDLIITVVETGLQWLIEIPELFISVVNAVVGIITDIPEVIETLIDAVLEWITSVPDLILDVVDTALSWISDDSDLIITVIETGLQWLIDVPDMVTSIVEAFLDFITSIPDVTDAILNAFESWIDSIPDFITDLVSAFFGWITEVPELVVKVVGKILDWFTDDHNLIETVVSTWLSFITEIPGLIGLIISTWIEWIIEAPGMVLDFITRALLPFGLLGPDSPLNALNIFGFLQDLNLPFISLSSIGNTSPNVLVMPGFDDSNSISVATGWSRDATVGHTDPGSAKAVASGKALELQSVAVPVGEAQNLTAKVWLKWAGLTYTGAQPVTLCLNRYNGTTYLGTTVLAGATSPSSTQGSWTQLVGPTYVVPAGVTHVKVAFKVTSTTTGGTIWFDDAELRKTTDGLPQSWIFNLIPDLGELGDFIKQVVDIIFDALGATPIFGGFISALLMPFRNLISGWFDDTEDTAAVASDASMGLTFTRDALVSGITASEQTAVDDDTVVQAVTSQTATIISQGAALDALTSQGNADNNSGVGVLDNFEETFTGQLNPLKWQKFVLSGTSPTMETANGHDANMNGDGEVMYRWIGDGAHTLTNYQRIAVTIASQLAYPGFGDVRRSEQAAYCRVSDDGTKWVRAHMTNVNRLVVDFRNGGVTGTLYDSGDYAVQTPGPGSSLAIEPGVGADERLFRIYRGSTPLVVVDDVSNLTDVTQKGHGMGMKQDAGFGPGSFTQYTASDNQPPAVPGVQFRAYRSLTTQVNMGSRGPGTFGVNNGYFDVEDYRTAGFAWDSTNQILTVLASGTYDFGLSYRSDSGLNTGVEWNSALLRDTGSGMLEFRLSQGAVPGTANTLSFLLSSFTNIRLNAGDKIKPGIRVSTFVGTNFFSGDTTGNLSEFTAVKVA